MNTLQGIEGGVVRPEEGELTPFKQFVFDQRWLVRQLVEDTRFNQAFLGITILNTLFLALAYDGMAARIFVNCAAHWTLVDSKCPGANPCDTLLQPQCGVCLCVLLLKVQTLIKAGKAKTEQLVA